MKIGNGASIFIGRTIKAVANFMSIGSGAQSAANIATLSGGHLTFTRPSDGGSVQTSASTVVTSGLGTNVARIGQYGASSTSRGLMFEEASINRVTASRNMSDASWVGGSSVIITPNAAVDPAGTSLADRVNVSSGGNAGHFVWPTSASTGPATGSVWKRRVSGTGNTRFLTQYTGGAGDGLQETITTLTTTWQRFSKFGRYTSQSIIYPAYGASLTSFGLTGALAMDEFVDMMQLEQLRYSTSFIPTDGAAVTRAAERLRTSTITPLLVSGRLRVEFRMIAHGSTTDYINFGSDSTKRHFYLWHIDSNNCVYVGSSDQRLHIIINGEEKILPTECLWNAGDTLDWYIEAGNGVAKAWLRVNDDEDIYIGETATAHSSISSGVGIDWLSDGTGGVASCLLQLWRIY